ncbi:MAG TPA: hypothetical protein VHL78_06245 [Actinomycetota bacterium]|nr:hypothetical protein [Actinomycetota bacterium]
MRRIRWTAGAAAAGLALSLTWLAPAMSQPQDHAFSVFDVNGPYEKVIDVGSAGFGAGDVILQHHPLLDPGTAERVGTAVTKVTIVRNNASGNAEFIIDCTLKLEAGQVVFYGASRFFRLVDGDVFPITGGSGAYDGAAGSLVMQFSEVDGQSGTRLDLEFVTP